MAIKAKSAKAALEAAKLAITYQVSEITALSEFLVLQTSGRRQDYA
jgi:hypothetical protein